MSADRNPQGFGIRPEDQTPAQQVYRYHHQRQIQERMKAQERGQTEPPPVNVARFLAEQRQRVIQSPEPSYHGRGRPQRARDHSPIGQLGPSRHSEKRHSGRNKFRGGQ